MMLNYAHYQIIGKAIHDTSAYLARYECGDCGRKNLKAKCCSICKNTTHFHNMNYINSMFRKIFKCNKCNFKKCIKCNTKYTELSKTCHKCMKCHIKNEKIMFCYAYNKCVDQYTHKPNNIACKKMLNR